jgi:hypothetical protein
MSSFELPVEDQLSLAGSAFLDRVTSEMRRAASAEKVSRKLTQQAIANEVHTSRHVINRQMQGIENVGARRIGEIFHVLGWEPFFEARPIPATENYFLSNVEQPAAPEGKIYTQDQIVSSDAPYVSIQVDP